MVGISCSPFAVNSSIVYLLFFLVQNHSRKTLFCRTIRGRRVRSVFSETWHSSIWFDALCHDGSDFGNTDGRLSYFERDSRRSQSSWQLLCVAIVHPPQSAVAQVFGRHLHAGRRREQGNQTRSKIRRTSLSPLWKYTGRNGFVLY